MINSVIYTSNSGFTQKYAELIAKELSIPCYNLKEAESGVPEGEHIIYLGWVKANRIVGLDKAFKKYVPCCVCGVGLNEFSEKTVKNLTTINKTGTAPLFYLQGGFNMNKQKGLNKILMKLIAYSLSQKADKTENDKNMLMAINGAQTTLKRKI